MGSYEFSMHSVVAARDQTVEAPLHNDKKSNSGSIRLTGTEKKDGWGQYSCKFNVSCEIKVEAPLFFTVSRADENKSSFKTTYKSECRKNNGRGGLLWNSILTDTDTLARTDDNCEV